MSGGANSGYDGSGEGSMRAFKRNSLMPGEVGNNGLPDYNTWSSGYQSRSQDASDITAHQEGLQQAYTGLTTPDSFGRLPYGTSIGGLSYDQPSTFDQDGQSFARTGQFDSRLNTQYSPEYGYYAPADQFANLRADTAQQMKDEHGGFRKWMDGPGPVMTMMGLGTGAALGGYFPGVDAAGAAIPAGQTGIMSQLGYGNSFSGPEGGGADGAEAMSGGTGDVTGLGDDAWGMDYGGVAGETTLPAGHLSAGAATGAGSGAPWSLGGAGQLLGGLNSARALGLLGGAAAGALGSSGGGGTQTTQTQTMPNMPAQTSSFLDSAMTGANPYLGQTTQMGSNPYAENPYFESTLNRTLDDVRGRVNAQFGNGNAFGSSGNQELLARNLGDISSGMRSQELGNQRALSEADLNRRAMYGAGDLTRNASVYSSDMANRLRAAALSAMGSNSFTTSPNPYQPSMLGNMVGGGMVGGALLPWIMGTK